MFDCKKILDEISDSGIYGIFGKPRAGKTSIAAGIIYENEKRKRKGKGLYFDRIYCTDETIKGCCHISYKQFGKWYIKDNSLIILEECGLGLDSRNWVKLEEVVKRTIALIGHHKATILWSSQTADIEKSLRVRTNKIYMVEKWIGNISEVIPIEYSFGVDNERGELKDIYSMPQGIREKIPAIITGKIKFINRKPYYKQFDSYVDEFYYPIEDPYEKYIDKEEIERMDKEKNKYPIIRLWSDHKKSPVE